MPTQALHTNGAPLLDIILKEMQCAPEDALDALHLIAGIQQLLQGAHHRQPRAHGALNWGLWKKGSMRLTSCFKVLITGSPAPTVP